MWVLSHFWVQARCGCYLKKLSVLLERICFELLSALRSVGMRNILEGVFDVGRGWSTFCRMKQDFRGIRVMNGGWDQVGSSMCPPGSVYDEGGESGSSFVAGINNTPLIVLQRRLVRRLSSMSSTWVFGATNATELYFLPRARIGHTPPYPQPPHRPPFHVLGCSPRSVLSSVNRVVDAEFHFP